MQERDYQAYLIKKIRRDLLGSLILKNNAAYLQGVPDLTVFYGPRWGMLEVKIKEPRPGTDDFEPNQEWYIQEFSTMSFCAVIFPKNEREVLRGLYKTLRSIR